MKKVIFGILSFLLISPVFADTIDLTQQNFISFESLNSSSNITYGGFKIKGNTTTLTDFFYLNSSLTPVFDIGYLDSSFTQYGGTYNTSSGFVFSISGDSIYNHQLNNGTHYGLLGIGFNNNKLINGLFSMYFQARASSYLPNYVLNFGASPNSGFHYLFVKNSFVRALYNGSDFWFKNNDYPVSSVVSSPLEIQVFSKGSNSFFDTKGLGFVNNQYLSNISSSVGNGFSFVSDLNQIDTVYYDDLDFYSVLPNWDSSWDSSSSSFSVPSSSFIQGIYIFKNNSFSRDSNFENIGVISKCSIDLCSGLDLTGYLSTLVVSNYSCDFSQNFLIKNNCNLVGGGFLTGVLGNITGLDQPLTKTSLSLIFFDSKTVSTYYNSLGYSYSFGSSPYSLNLSHFVRDGTNYSFSTTSFPISFITGYSVSNPPDILSAYSDSFPDISHGSGILDTLCQDDIFGTNPLCNSDLDGTWSDLTEDGSGNLVLTIYDDFSDMSGPCDNGYFTDVDGRPYYQYLDTGHNVCIKNYNLPSYTSSPEIIEFLSGSDLTGLESSIGNAFSDIVGPNFKFYSCPFRSPLKAFHLSSIGGLSEFLLDKFFDVNITGPFNCLLGGILYSVTDSQSLGTRLLLNSYNGEKYLNNFSDDFKNTISWLLFAGMVLFFWSFRPKEH